MNWDTFTGDFANANDQWTFDSIPGAADALKKHWDTYFTEDDIKKIAATGINALRIPIGFWAYDNAGTPYIQGADAYLEKAIGWARNAGLKVWVDCHGSPGSQNGFDNSGHAGAVEWQQADNLARSTAVLQTMGKKYGSMDYADVVVGLEMVNEPISWGANNIEVTKVWARDTFNAVKSVVANPDLVIVMHDAFYSAPAWVDFANGLNANRKFGIDTHLYQIFTDADNQMTQPQHIEKACNWANELGTANNAAPTYVGEFSAASNICVNPDGTTTPGWSCSVDGCQCQAGDWNMWGPELIEQTRRFVEAELDAFERASSGWFMWAAKGPGGWGFLNGIEKGIIPNPVTSRLYPNQCGYPSPSA
jgi:glucan 1,3-beta-glucosidase